MSCCVFVFVSALLPVNSHSSPVSTNCDFSSRNSQGCGGHKRALLALNSHPRGPCTLRFETVVCVSEEDKSLTKTWRRLPKEGPLRCVTYIFFIKKAWLEFDMKPISCYTLTFNHCPSNGRPFMANNEAHMIGLMRAAKHCFCTQLLESSIPSTLISAPQQIFFEASPQHDDGSLVAKRGVPELQRISLSPQALVLTRVAHRGAEM